MNLAIDEALLEAAEAGEAGERLRLWEFPGPVAVIGRGSRIAAEVNLAYCDANRVPILRRCSGGAAVVAGPGCLIYSIVLSLRQRPQLRRLDRAHAFVMGSLAATLDRRLPGVSVQGTCDLTWRNLKFSGNSLRVAREHLLYHGTLLYAADVAGIASALGMPPRRPEYRQDRAHSSFITNLPLGSDILRQAVVEAFGATEISNTFPVERAGRLADDRYRRRDWTYRH